MEWVVNGLGKGGACFQLQEERPLEMDETPNGKRPAALKKSRALITVGFFSPEMFLQPLNEALPTFLSGTFLNPTQAFVLDSVCLVKAILGRRC